jgi:hypothetical protein
MTRASIGVIACAIACSWMAETSKAQFLTGSYIKHSGQLVNTLITPESGSFNDLLYVSLDRHFEQSTPAVNSLFFPPLVSYTGDVSIHGGDGSFGIGVDAGVVVPADASGPSNIANGSISASVLLKDTWFADAVSPAHTLRLTAAWNVNGSLGANAEGEAPPGPFQAPYINANAGSAISFFAEGDLPNSVTISGGNLVQAFTNETYNNTFTNNSQPNPLSTQSTFPFPNRIVMTFLMPNDGYLGVNFEADASAGAYVDNEDGDNAGIAIGTAFFGHTFTWGGITSVVDADTGQPITDWTLTSASGFDWMNAAPGPSTVPEPSTLGLAALGGLGLFVNRRRGRTERTGKGSEQGSRTPRVRQ